MPSSAGSAARRRRLLAHRRVLSRVDVRGLLPFAWVERLDLPFLFLFGAEFAVRSTLVFRGRWVEDGRVDDEDDDRTLRMPGLGRSVLLSFDFLALSSVLRSCVDGLRVFEPGAQGTDGRGGIEFSETTSIWAIGPEIEGR